MNKKCQLSYFSCYCLLLLLYTYCLWRVEKIPINSMYIKRNLNLWVYRYKLCTYWYTYALVIYLFVYLCLWPSNFTRMKQSKSECLFSIYSFLFICLWVGFLCASFYLLAVCGDKREIKRNYIERTRGTGYKLSNLGECYTGKTFWYNQFLQW